MASKEEVEKIYARYKGLTVTFPKKLYSKQYVNNYVKKYYGKKPIREISRHLDLSERRIRQLAKEVKNEV